jgi:hypothetical protein
LSRPCETLAVFNFQKGKGTPMFLPKPSLTKAL